MHNTILEPDCDALEAVREALAFRPMDTSDIDPETGEAWGVDPDAADNCPEVT
jgi:hypothetical protein